MLQKMTRNRTVHTDEILVEFNGSLCEFVNELGYLERGFRVTYPPEEDLWWDSSEAIEEHQMLLKRFSEKAPPGYTFGGHIMQPQCFGYWKIT
jgi:hypothetical protein